MKIFVENFRSLCGEHTVQIKPLTILVGENSSGKSTFLAILAQIFNRSFPSYRPPFNVPPFDLGTYESIATYKGGKFGRAKHFSIGFLEKDNKTDVSVRATYGDYHGQPELASLDVEYGPRRLLFETEGPSGPGKLTLSSSKRTVSEVRVERRDPRYSESDFPVFIPLERAVLDIKDKKLRSTAADALDKILFGAYRLKNRTPALALAPVRTKPRRTYDPLSDEFSPEGEHIPVILARIWDRPADPDNKNVINSLKKFGKNSSLFGDIAVRRLGKRPNDPFQVLVNIAGPSANLLDVGYGVSQALPIIVDSTRSLANQIILLQQPEIHMHPRGQAALGSFFVNAVASRHKHIVVETHSDYLLDRVRFEVARKTIMPSEVQILYFEKSKIETTIHEVGLDGNGNVLNAPPSYRQFFLDEEIKLLSRTRK